MIDFEQVSLLEPVSLFNKHPNLVIMGSAVWVNDRARLLISGMSLTEDMARILRRY